ncbi:hypothetical protein PVL29_013728 [Vitis rotundifolia]|uniref:Uncharacterized protein n=1 Tax=Vitis rotundifolia TaxID=103349 RepID=A0AA38ZM38_VITRO|nr:hypothetical protein PVL29_013728 [Vitis rotundifolia]
MENQNPPQLIHKSSEQVGNWIKLSKVWIPSILLQIGLFAFKYKPGENPLFKADHVGVFGLLGLSLIVYIITLVVLSLMKTPTPPTSRLPLLICHVCWSCGALTCGILSSLLFPYGWVIFCFYALPLWLAPCKPSRIRRWLRLPPNTQQHLDSVDLIVEELPVLHPAASTFDIQEYSSSTSSTSSSLTN